MIVGLCGPAGSGKTTIAKTLVENHGFIRKPFAGPLKRMIAAGFNIEPYLLDGPREVKALPMSIFGGKTLREVMQTIGTEWGRNLICEDLWANAWQTDIGIGYSYVADDLRFANEAAAVRNLGGYVIRLNRDGSGINSSHASEKLEGFVPDLEIDNNRPAYLVCRDILNQVRSITAAEKIA